MRDRNRYLLKEGDIVLVQILVGSDHADSEPYIRGVVENIEPKMGKFKQLARIKLDGTAMSTTFFSQEIVRLPRNEKKRNEVLMLYILEGAQ